jgi:hypothetical protein
MKRALYLFLFICALGGGGVLTWLGIQTVRHELRLREKPAVADAKLTDTATYVVTRNHIESTDYEVRYAFQLNGQTFTCGDETGRDDLWATMANKGDWDAARAAGTLQVTYLPDEPRINRPVLAGNAPLGDSLAGLILGGVLGLTGLIGSTVLVRRMLRR